MIVAQNIGFTTAEGRVLFSAINVIISQQKTGLVGKNGAGKTTLLRVLVGELKPTMGNVSRTGTVGYLSQDFHFLHESTVGECFGAGSQLAALKRVHSGEHTESDLEIIDDWEVEDKLKAQLDMLELGHIDLDRKALTLSGGELTRLALAAVIWRKPDLLVLDEPTNNLDIKSREVLYAFIKSWDKGLLVVSHDKSLLMLMDQIMELTSLGISTYGGNFVEYQRQKILEDEAVARQIKDAHKTVEKVKTDSQLARERQQKRQEAGKKTSARGGQAKVILNKAKERSEKTVGTLSQISERLKREAQQKLIEAHKKSEFSATMNIDFAATHVPAGKVVLDIQGLSFNYLQGTKLLLNDFCLTITGPERIALQGRNGSGKSTLFKLIVGLLKPVQGTIKIGVHHVAYLDQHLTMLSLQMTLLENFQRYSPSLSVGECRNRLAHFLFFDDDVFKRVESLSGGEKLRLALACLFVSDQTPHLLLLDEPTNHMDFESMLVLEKALQGYQGAMIIVSHDKAFLSVIGIEREVFLHRLK